MCNPGKLCRRGVFWVKVHPANVPISAKEAMKGVDGLCNVGVRPTFTPESHILHCEVFLLNKGGNLYGRKLRVVFLRRIRAEKRFASRSSSNARSPTILRKQTFTETPIFRYNSPTLKKEKR